MDGEDLTLNSYGLLMSSYQKPNDVVATIFAWLLLAAFAGACVYGCHTALGPVFDRWEDKIRGTAAPDRAPSTEDGPPTWRA